MTHPDFKVRLSRVKTRGKTMLVARVVGGPKNGQTFSRPDPSEIDKEKYWNDMEFQFGGRCFR